MIFVGTCLTVGAIGGAACLPLLLSRTSYNEQAVGEPPDDGLASHHHFSSRGRRQGGGGSRCRQRGEGGEGRPRR
jgi:hypothetical protein